MYSLAYLPSCKDEIKKYTKKNKELRNALKAKLNKILTNPYQFKPLRGLLAGLRRVHILKSFVHHDEAYK